MGITHFLKCWNNEYDAVVDGRKKFEWRKDDRGGFQVGDILVLQRFNPREPDDERGMIQPTFRVRVTYIVRGMFNVPPEYCVMSIEPEPSPELMQLPASEEDERITVEDYDNLAGMLSKEQGHSSELYGKLVRAETEIERLRGLLSDGLLNPPAHLEPKAEERAVRPVPEGWEPGIVGARLDVEQAKADERAGAGVCWRCNDPVQKSGELCETCAAGTERPCPSCDCGAFVRRPSGWCCLECGYWRPDPNEPAGGSDG